MTKVLVTNVKGPAGVNGADGAPGAPGADGTPLAFNDLTDVDTTGAVDGKFLSRVSGIWVPVNAPSGGSLSVQDENGTAITNVTQLDFQGAGVTATAGTGEVVVTIPGSSSNRFYQDWAGAWSATVDFPQGAIVSRNYSLYVATQDPAVGVDPAAQVPALGTWNAGANTVTSTNWSGVTDVAFKFQVTSAIRVKGISERWGGAGAAGQFGLASSLGGGTPVWLVDSSGANTVSAVTPATGTVTVTFTGHVDLIPGVDYYIVAKSCAANLARADSNSMPNTGIIQSNMYWGSTFGSSDGTRGEFRLYSESGAPWDLLVSPTVGSSPVMASYKSTVGEANSPLPNSPSTFAEWRTAARLTLAAAVGQKILCSGSAFLDNGANTYYFDWGIVNATTGAIIRRFGGAYGQGFASGASYNSPALSADFVVQSGDVVSGNVTIAQLWMGNSSRNLLLLDYIYGIRAVNLG